MKKGRNAQKIADLMILFVAVSWGFSFMAMDIALTELTPITLNAFRFVGAFMVAMIFAFKIQHSVRNYAFFGILDFHLWCKVYEFVQCRIFVCNVSGNNTSNSFFVQRCETE